MSVNQIFRDRSQMVLYAVAGVGVILALIVLFIHPSSKSTGSNNSTGSTGTTTSSDQSNNNNTSSKITTILSPFANNTDEVAINDGLHNPANMDATIEPVNIFFPYGSPLTNQLIYRFHETLPTILDREIVPTYSPTYAHIDASSFDCKSIYDCGFSFYLDSPERYYRVRLYHEDNGDEAYSFKQLPLPEVSQ